MNKFRKPYVSCLLAVLLLFASCQTNTNYDEDEILSEDIFQKSQYNLEEFVTDNLVSLESISVLINKESNIDLQFLQNNIDNISSVDALKATLLNSNIINVDEFVSVLMKVKDNTEKFVHSNPSFLEIDQEEQENMIINEIELQLSKKQASIFHPKSDCWDDRVRAENRCSRNWAIGMGVSAIAGFVSFGWGTVVGFLGAQAQVVLCLSDALAEFKECQENNGQGQ